jgi:hypothetical protein
VLINNQNSEVLSEFYIIIFLNKLKIVENTNNKKRRNLKKIKNKKASVAKAMSVFRDSRVPSCLSGPRTNVPAEPLSHRPR